MSLVLDANPFRKWEYKGEGSRVRNKKERKMHERFVQ